MSVNDKTRFLIPIFLFLTTPLISQTAHFQNYTTTEGLGQNTVLSMCQDRDGMIWFGTQEGVSVFNGRSFKTYTKENGLGENTVLSIFEDQEGGIWLGTLEGGVTRYFRDDEKETWITYKEKDGLANNDVRCIFQDRKGTIWFGTRTGGVSRFSTENGKPVWKTFSQTDGLGGNDVFTIWEDQEGYLWFGTAKGASRFDGATFKTFTVHDGLAHNEVRYILEDRRGNLWFGTLGGVSCLVKTKGDKWFSLTRKDGLAHNEVLSILEDREGNFWFATRGGGVTRYNPHLINDEWRTFTKKDGLGFDRIVSLLEDKEGGIWIGTGGGGVSRYSKQKWTTYTEKDGLASNHVWAIFEDRNGYLWVGTDGAGLSRHKAGKWVTFTETNGLTNNFVYSITEDRKGDIWVGTGGGGVSIYSNGKWARFLQKDGVINNYINTVIQDRAGNMWLATDGGVSKYRGGKWTSFTKDQVGFDRVWTVFEDHNGYVWFGTPGGGVSRHDPRNGRWTNFTTDSGLVDNRVDYIFESKDHTIWFGTQDGLSHLIPEHTTYRWVNYTVKDGLPNNVIYAIIQDDEGYLWVSTNRGVSRFNPDAPKNEQFNNFDNTDGLGSNECNQSAAFKDRNGRIWFGTVGGISSIDPKNYPVNTVAPKIVINGMRIYDNEIPLSRDLVFDHRQNIITIQFTAISFQSPEKIRYQYKLEGFETDWSGLTERNSVRYTNLDPGEYTFQVKARNNDGTWSQGSASIPFRIQPPFWKTWWFIIGLIFVILYAPFLLDNYRVRNIKQRNIELEKKVEERTLELAVKNQQLETVNQLKDEFLNIVSHDLRNPLTVVTGTSEFILKKYITDLPLELEQGLKSILNSSDRMTKLINSLLDISKMESGRMEMVLKQTDLSGVVEQFVNQHRLIAQEKDIRLQYYHSDQGILVEIDESRIWQVLSNLFTNAVKFTPKGGSIGIKVDPRDHWVDVSVVDSGIGIPMDKLSNLFDRLAGFSREGLRGERGSGLGLTISKKLIELHRGVIWVESEVQKGTKFTFSIPRS